MNAGEHDDRARAAHRPFTAPLADRPEVHAWALSVAVDAAGLAVYHVDLASGASWSTGFARLAGAGADGELTRDRWRSLIHPGDVDRYLAEEADARTADAGFDRVQTYRIHRYDGSWMVLEDHRRVAATPDGSRRAIVGIVRDVTDAWRALRDAELLARISDILGARSGAMTAESLLEMLARAAVPAFADTCAFHLVAGEQLERIALVPESGPAIADVASITRGRIAMSDEPSSVAAAARTMQPVVVTAPRPYLSVPLVGRGGLLGVVSFKRLEDPPSPFTARDVPLAQEFARRGAALLEEVQLRERAETGEGRLQRLQRAITELARVTTATDVLATVVHYGIPAVEAARGLVILERVDGNFEIASEAGMTGEVVDRWHRFTGDTVGPAVDSVRRGHTIVMHDLDDASARYPGLAHEWVESGAKAWAAVPFPRAASVRGAVWFAFDVPQRFDDAHLQVLDALVASTSQALVRAAAYDAEQRGREMADGLAALTTALAVADSPENITRAVGECVARAGAATYAVLSLGTPPNLERFEFRDGAAVDTAGRIDDLTRVARTPVADAMTSGKPVLVRSVGDRLVDYPDVRSASIAAGLRAWASFPLRDAAGATVGGLGFSWTDEQRFDDDQVRGLTTIIDVVEQALERVKSQRTERVHRRRTELLAALTADLAAALRVDDVLAAAQFGVGAVFDAATVMLGEPTVVPGVRPANRSRRSPRPRIVEPNADTGGVAELPLVVGADRRSTLTIELPPRRSFEPAERQVLRVVAEVIGESIARAHAFEQQETRRGIAERLQRASVALNGVKPDDIHAELGANAADVVEADSWAVFLVDDDLLRVVATPSDGAGAVPSGATLVLQSTAPLTDAARRGEVIVVGDDDEWTRRYPEMGARYRAAGFSAAITIPLRGARGDAAAVVALAFRDRATLGDAVLAALPEIAKQWSAVLERFELQREERQARGRLAVLQRLTAQLSSARGLADIAALVRDDLPHALEARSTMIGVVEEDAIKPWAYNVDDRDAVGEIPLSSQRPSAEAVRNGRSVYVESFAELQEQFPDAVPSARRLSTAATAVVPLRWEQRVVGVLALAYGGTMRFSDADQELLETFGELLAQTLERIRLNEYEHQVAVAMQHAMLGTPDACDTVDVGAAYRSAEELLEIGGDWFDVVDLGDDSVGLVVGDVVGHNVTAAAAMGQLRSSVRAVASVIDDPGEVLTRLERFVDGVEAARSSTVVYAVLEPLTSRVRYSSAGHLPPLVVGPEGHTEFLMDGRGVPLGAFPAACRTTGEAFLAPGSTLVLYSDGLVERRGESLEVGLARLASTAAALRALPAQALCDRLVDAMVGRPQRDDVAVLTVRPAVAHYHRRLPADAAELAPVRRELRGWLGAHDVDHDVGEELLVAVGEALSNTIDHAYLSGPQGPVELDVAVRRGAVRVRVRDWGRWRTEPALGNRGRGMALMKMLCDTVDVSTGENGTTVDLVRAVDDGRGGA